jgi:hypothetical protein
MHPLTADTAPEQLARYFELLRRLEPAARLRIVSATSRRVRQLAEAGVRARLGDATEAEVRDALVELLYGPEARQRLQRHWR